LRTPPRILVVDDNPTNLEVLQVRLSAQGYEIVTAVDGEDALRRRRELEPDLVLLDVMMPKLDGISVLKELKADTTSIPLVKYLSEGREMIAGTRLLAPFRLSVVSMLANLTIEANRFETTAHPLDASPIADPKAR
jgi:CheY-like chemotaxis protein